MSVRARIRVKQRLMEMRNTETQRLVIRSRYRFFFCSLLYLHHVTSIAYNFFPCLASSWSAFFAIFFDFFLGFFVVVFIRSIFDYHFCAFNSFIFSSLDVAAIAFFSIEMNLFGVCVFILFYFSSLYSCLTFYSYSK